MKARVQEMKSSGGKDVDPEPEVLAKLKDMPNPDRGMGERMHAIVKATAPSLTPRLYYGMPAYAKDGKVLFWFKPASKFKTRYATVGFSDAAKLDGGDMWPTEYAVLKLTGATEAKFSALVKKAAR